MILVTGSTGFLGRAVIKAALQRGLDVVGLCRASSDIAGLHLPSTKVVRAELSDVAALTQALQGVSAVVHTAATTSQSRPNWELSYQTNVSGTQNLICACEAAGIQRFIHISTQSAKAENLSCYGKSKFLADRTVENSNLNWTIIRPSLIYGPGQGGLFYKMNDLLKRWPLVPVIGPGDQLLRPILVTDLAGAILDCLANEKTIGKTYNLGGADEVTFDQFVAKLLAVQGIKKTLVHLPVWLCHVLASLLGKISNEPPITKDNILGLKYNTSISNSLAEQDFNYHPETLDEGLKVCFVDDRTSKTPESIEQLTRQVRYFHDYLIRLEAPDRLVGNYVKAHSHYLTKLSHDESTFIEYIIANHMDVEALELALRHRLPKNVLTRKFHIYAYLLEVEPTFYKHFINEKQTRVLAFLKLGFLTLRSVYKFVKGAILLRICPTTGTDDLFRRDSGLDKQSNHNQHCLQHDLEESR